MDRNEAIELLKNMHWSITTKMNREVPSSLALLMAIKALDKDIDVPSKWISVSERLPDNTDTVLIVHKGGVSTGWYNGRYWERGASSNHRMLKTVTHWMPFPEAPKGE